MSYTFKNIHYWEYVEGLNNWYSGQYVTHFLKKKQNTLINRKANCMGQLVYPLPTFTWVEGMNEAKLDFVSSVGCSNQKNLSCGKLGYFLEEHMTTARMAAD